MTDLDILALAAHRDDVEQTCGGTLLKAAQAGQRCGILDLTRGEMGTRGDADTRGREADAAAKILKAQWRQALDLPDGRVENTFKNKLKVARVLREVRPRVLILPYWQGRHPDHYTASTLGYEATFLAGLTKLGSTPATAAIEDAEQFLALKPHRPYKIVYASLYYDVRPSFVVDISAQFDAKVQSLLAYESQYSDQSAGTGLFPAHAEVRQRLETMARFYGLLAGVDYAEPFVQKEVGLVEDLTLIPVKSM
ncbi:LmbE-like protein [Candidatus Koribacter versatilis Ellin345]|uniref:LmbE-like protein n=1 Tax=Koribacter versatilis (strain Ellin345) TaxID=204669 RepID=Q1IL16_KORVE|nr:bacillithiol biosynthesis deacetylase BshB1 [Candidatus Koribacter versatilis]ABF42434.1 LmbE-like protein [Candidatus Koribacter versatilis Ellin345]